MDGWMINIQKWPIPIILRFLRLSIFSTKETNLSDHEQQMMLPTTPHPITSTSIKNKPSITETITEPSLNQKKAEVICQQHLDYKAAERLHPGESLRCNIFFT